MRVNSLRKLPNHGKPWLEQDDTDLWELRGLNTPLLECAKRLGRSVYSTEIRWRLLCRQRGKPGPVTTLPPLASTREEAS